jgi:hypothetical protein
VPFGHLDFQTLPPAPPGFFLWGFLKERVYSNNPRSLEELKHSTQQTVADIDPGIISRATRNTLKTVNPALRKGGGHLRGLLKLLLKFFLTNRNLKKKFVLLHWYRQSLQMMLQLVLNRTNCISERLCWSRNLKKVMLRQRTYELFALAFTFRILYNLSAYLWVVYCYILHLKVWNVH